MTLAHLIYFACALAGVVFHWVTTAKSDSDRPTAVQWLARHYGYTLSTLGLTMASALFFMPTEMGVNANAAALAMGIAGGSAIKNLFVKRV